MFIFYLFVSIVLVCYIYANFSCITKISVLCIDRSLHNIKAQNQKYQRKASTIYLLMVYFKLCSTFLTLWSETFSYHLFYLQLLFVTKEYLHIFLTITQDIIRNIRKGFVWLIWYSCCIVSALKKFTYQILFQYFITNHQIEKFPTFPSIQLPTTYTC